MAKDVDGTLKEFGPLFAEATDQGMLEVKNSIEGGTAPATAAAKSSMEDVQDAMEAIDFTKTGKDAMSDLASGIKQKTGTATSAAKGVATSAKASAGDVSFYSVGYNMDSGMANGIWGGKSLVTSAAQSVAQSAYNAAKNVLGIHSPSTLFRDGVGKMITEGILAGMTAPDVLRDLERASGEVSDAAYDGMTALPYELGVSSGTEHYTTPGRAGNVINNYINIDGARYTDANELADVISDVLVRRYRREVAALGG